jgi:uncharacterized membrane protein YphA (DoxX/SURF4 family)
VGQGFAIGRGLFAIVVAALGAYCLIFSQFVPSLEPVPAALGQPTPWTWLTGLALMAGALSLLADRTARAGALLLATLFFLSVLLLHGPPLLANLKAQADDALHTLALGAAALVLAAGVRHAPGAQARWGRLIEHGGRVGRLCFGLCLIGFGIMHFEFFSFTADFIPAWIPLHRFWAVATGAAQIAAGVAVLSGVLARLAAILSAVMYGSWVVIVHAPRVLAHLLSHSEWTDLFTAAGLCAGALMVAGAIAGREVPR